MVSCLHMIENLSLFPEERKVVKLVCDGGVVGKNPSDFGGSWAYAAIDENDELVFSNSGFHKTEDRPTTNNHTELIAAIEALEAMPDKWSGLLVSDSQITLGRIFQGWRWKNVPQEYILRLRKVMSRLGDVRGMHVDGHATKAHLESGIGKRGNPVDKWNNFVDGLCTEVCNKVKGKI